MSQPSGCVDSIKKDFKEFLRGAVAQLLARASVQLISSRQDVLWREGFNGGTLGHEGSEQPIVTLVLGTLSGCVGMSEEGFGSPLLHLGKVSKLASVVHRNGLKDLGEVFAILVMELIHEVHDRLAGCARNTERKVGFRLFSNREKATDSFPARLPTTVSPSQWPSSRRRDAISGCSEILVP